MVSSSPELCLLSKLDTRPDGRLSTNCGHNHPIPVDSVLGDHVEMSCRARCVAATVARASGKVKGWKRIAQLLLACIDVMGHMEVPACGERV